MRKEFYIYRFNLLQAYFNGQLAYGKAFISNLDAYAYAWSMELYPLFDASFADEEFEEDFKIKKTYVENVATLLDTVVLDFSTKKISSYPTYYNIQNQYFLYLTLKYFLCSDLKHYNYQILNQIIVISVFC